DHHDREACPHRRRLYAYAVFRLPRFPAPYADGLSENDPAREGARSAAKRRRREQRRRHQSRARYRLLAPRPLRASVSLSLRRTAVSDGKDERAGTEILVVIARSPKGEEAIQPSFSEPCIASIRSQ